MIHQNFKLQFNGARLEQVFVDGNKIFENYRDCIDMTLCPTPGEKCYLGTCEKLLSCDSGNQEMCGDTHKLRNILLSFFDYEHIAEVQYKQWTQLERCSLATIVKDIDCFCDQFTAAIPVVKKHDYIARKQADFFKNTRNNLQVGEVLVVADFAENYAFLYQDSVQSVHYNNNQATVHPFACYTSSDQGIVPLNCIIISDHLDHNTASVHTFQSKLVHMLKAHVPNLRKVIYFSDGASSQYKNRFNMLNVLYHNEDFGVPAEWHFFATSHGKGPSDGLGGTLKRLATRASLQGVQIQTAKELFDWATRSCGIHVEYIPSTECVKQQKRLHSRFNKAVNIPGIRGMHCAIPSSSQAMVLKEMSSSPEGRLFHLRTVKEPLLVNNRRKRKRY